MPAASLCIAVVLKQTLKLKFCHTGSDGTHHLLVGKTADLVGIAKHSNLKLCLDHAADGWEREWLSTWDDRRYSACCIWSQCSPLSPCTVTQVCMRSCHMYYVVLPDTEEGTVRADAVGLRQEGKGLQNAYTHTEHNFHSQADVFPEQWHCVQTVLCTTPCSSASDTFTHGGTTGMAREEFQRRCCRSVIKHSGLICSPRDSPSYPNPCVAASAIPKKVRPMFSEYVHNDMHSCRLLSAHNVFCLSTEYTAAKCTCTYWL